MTAVKMDRLVMGYGLTPLQADYLRYIIEYAQDHNGNSPSMARIAKHFGVAWMSAKSVVKALEKRGAIEMKDGHIVIIGSTWRPAEYLVKLLEEERTRKRGMVYLISGNGLYKIGITRNTSEVRLIGLQTLSPVLLEIVYSFECVDPPGIEQTLHEHFESKRDHGEWFRLDDEDVEWIKRTYAEPDTP